MKLEESTFQVYKITNRINGKIYIGQHACSCNSCSYMGSGTAIGRALKKYGRENFEKEILFEFHSFAEMNEKEAEIVNEEFIARKDTYNLKTGGSNGICGLETRLKISRANSNPSTETRKKLSIANSGKILSAETRRRLSDSKRHISDETRRKLSEASTNITPERRKQMSSCARNRSDETRRKLSEALVGRRRDEKSIEKYKLAMKEKSLYKNVLKICPVSNEIIEKYEYMHDLLIGENINKSSNIIARNKEKRHRLWI